MRLASMIAVKCSMCSGFAGIENELSHHDKTQMLFGGAKTVVGEVVGELARLRARQAAAWRPRGKTRRQRRGTRPARR